jgi:FkbM family methyltransferase
VKAFLRTAIRKAGWDLHRFNAASSAMAQVAAAIQYVQADMVLDIGANQGQFVRDLRSTGYNGLIVSFEPLRSAHRQLSKAACKDPLWVVHPRTAIGGQDGTTKINISANSVSSSLLPMMDSHSRVCSSSSYIGIEGTPIHRLDSVSPAYLKPTSRVFIKIDTQGFEWEVLNGAADTLQLAKGVLLEMSLVPLYEKQHLWTELIERMKSDGFVLWAIQKGFTDPKTGRTLQIDGVFLRA